MSQSVFTDQFLFFIVRALSHELRMAHFLKLLVKIALTVALDDAL